MPLIRITFEDGRPAVEINRCPTCDALIPEGAALDDECDACGTPFRQITLAALLAEARPNRPPFTDANANDE